MCLFFFSSRRRHTRYWRDWSSTCALPIYLGPLLGHDPRPDDRLLAVDGLAEVADRLAGVHLDLRDVRVLEEIAVQGNELLAFGRGPGSPVRSEAACRDLGEIEELAGHLPDHSPSLGGSGVLLQLGVGA